MKLKAITQFLEQQFPLSLQESYDNSGLLIGDKEIEITGVLICLDSIEEIVNEAILKNCNLIVAHHPIVFKGLKKITNSNYIERVVSKCIKNDIALYAIHTNLDNHFQGVNREIVNRIGLKNVKILQPITGNLSKLVVFVPKDSLHQVDEAVFNNQHIFIDKRSSLIGEGKHVLAYFLYVKMEQDFECEVCFFN